MKYGALEIQDKERRELAAMALAQLWDAMNLSSPSQIEFPGESLKIHEERYALYRLVGEAILGEDCPEKEIKT